MNITEYLIYSKSDFEGALGNGKAIEVVAKILRDGTRNQIGAPIAKHDEIYARFVDGVFTEFIDDLD